MFQGALSRQGC